MCIFVCVYSYTPIQARFHGSDGAVRIAPHGVLGFEVGGALVRGVDLDSEVGLIGLPADRLTTWVLLQDAQTPQGWWAGS